MIINFDVNFNNYDKKIAGFYGIWDFTCPCCNAVRSFSRHAFYTRNICFWADNQVIEKALNVLRLKCNSCKATHAVLPADIVPYMIYSFSCVLMILLKYFNEELTVLNLCDHFKITFQLIYLFIRKFTYHFRSCINFLRVYLSLELDFDTSFKEVIAVINKIFLPYKFQYQYLNFSKTVFLMCRSRNILSRQLHIGSYFKPPT